MGLVPDGKLAKMQWYQSKIAPWTTNAVAIGTTAAAVTALETKLTAAQDAVAAQTAAHEAAKTATAAADNAIAVLSDAGADIIRQIRAQGEIVGNSVYQLAEIPAPATPSPRPAPGEPTDFKVKLMNNGSLEIAWKCSNPRGASGTMYQV